MPIFRAPASVQQGVHVPLRLLAVATGGAQPCGHICLCTPLIPNISEGNYNGDIHVTIKNILYCIINYIGGTQNER